MLAALERFVVDNDDLLALESLIGRFNIFDALDIARVEIRHSNFLAFILDPAESHGQGGGPRCLDSLMGGISSESVFGFLNFIEKHQAALVKGWGRL